MQATDAGDDGARERRLGKRVVIALYGGFAVAFVIYAAVLLTMQCFGLGEGTAAARKPLPAPCSRGVAALASAASRAGDRAAHETDAARAARTFDDALAPEWTGEAEVRSACAAERRGDEAFAAVLRLKLAERARASRDAAGLAAVRGEVDAYLK